MKPLGFDATPPAIAPVPAGTPRPRWSVMIPTYHCACYLEETLRSVLVQDPGADEMQIEVVDDASTRDDPEAVVRTLAPGRVGFFRQPRNGGAIHNFNTCVERSRGQLIHLLHGDDRVEPGFYAAMEALADRHPDCGIFAARHLVIDAAGGIDHASPPQPEMETPARTARFFYLRTPVQCAAVVMRRRDYEEQGGFIEALIHTADRERWARAWARSGGVMLPRVLASYRYFAGNDSARLRANAENLRDLVRCTEVFTAIYPDYPRCAARAEVARTARSQAALLRTAGRNQDADAAEAIYRALEPAPRRWLRGLRSALSSPKRRWSASAVRGAKSSA